MENWVCAQLERDLADATRKLVEAHKVVGKLRSHKPERRDPGLQAWREDLAVAIGRETDAMIAHQRAAKKFDECKGESPRPHA